MTDRDHFAAAALTGLLSNVERYQKGPLTEQAFEIADFMLRERERVTEPTPVFASGSGSVTPVSYQKSDEKRVNWPTNRGASGAVDEPVAWAVTMGDGSVYEAFAAHQHDEAVELAKKCLFGADGPLPLAPLYRHPAQPAEASEMTDIVTRLRQARANMIGTDDEQHYFDCHEAAGEIERLRRWCRLTDVERDALKEAADAYSDNDDDQGSAEIADALHGLLDRLNP
jgi:hypothetical protein